MKNFNLGLEYLLYSGFFLCFIGGILQYQEMWYNNIEIN